MHGSTLGSGYDRWLTTQPEPPDEEPPLKCDTCGRFVSRSKKNELRREPWEDGWQCDGATHKVDFVYCNDVHDDAARCWQDGWTKEEIAAHDAEHHKPMSDSYTKCEGMGSCAHEPHYVVETCGVDIYYYCTGGHEAKERVM